MSADQSKREPADRSFINQHEPHYLKFWTKQFGIDAARLLQLIGQHGVMTATIRRALDDSLDSR